MTGFIVGFLAGAPFWGAAAICGLLFTGYLLLRGALNK